MFAFAGSKTKELGLYSLCGAIATITDIVILTGLELYSGLNYVLASAMAFGVASIVKFILLVILVLGDYRRRSLVYELLLFIVIAVVGLAINSLIISLFPESWLFGSKLLAIVVVIAWNFIMMKLSIFNQPLII
jgi:putative flippase GtrA